AGVVHQVVDYLGGDDLAAQRVRLDPLPEPFAQRGGEVVEEVGLQEGVVRKLRDQQLVLEGDLGVGEQDGQLRLGQSEAALPPLGDRALARQELQFPVEM